LIRKDGFECSKKERRAEREKMKIKREGKGAVWKCIA
jgi:hypothetical protein